MFDVWIGDALLLLAVPVSMVSTVLRLKPRLLPGEGMRLFDLETLQAEYQKRYPIRLFLLRVCPALLAIYFGIRILQWPPDVKANGPGLTTLLIALFAVYVFSTIFISMLRIRHERAFVGEHPEFSDSFLPVLPRVLIILPWIVSFGILVSGLAFHEPATQLVLVGLGFTGLVIGGKLRTRLVTQSRHLLPWDEPLGMKIAEVVEQFGITPKRLVLLPSLVANAYAMPDGSVIVTTALRTLATPEEVAGVIAHELSHVRDREGKKWQRLRIAGAIPIGLLAGFVIAAAQGAPYEPLAPPLIVFGAMTLSMVSTLWFCGRTRPREFKCDADAAKIGLGLELAGCLDKLTRFMGVAPRWIGVDRYLLTHPSLEERVARLRSA